jgi:hypothetical protein
MLTCFSSEAIAGWYDYTADASDVVEQLFHDWTFNPSMHQRIVASGTWEYLVDLCCMTQTNVVHLNRTVRHIRRWTQALGDDGTPPGAFCGEHLLSPDQRYHLPNAVRWPASAHIYYSCHSLPMAMHAAPLLSALQSSLSAYLVSHVFIWINTVATVAMYLAMYLTTRTGLAYFKH